MDLVRCRLTAVNCGLNWVVEDVLIRTFHVVCELLSSCVNASRRVPRHFSPHEQKLPKATMRELGNALHRRVYSPIRTFNGMLGLH